MPKRRVTKASIRKPPKLRDGDEGKSLSELERMEKLRVFLADFDMEVKRKIGLLEAEKAKMIVDVDVQFHTLITHIPLEIRKMKMQDFIDCGGTIHDALRCIRGYHQDSVVETSSVRRPRLASTKSKMRTTQMLDSINEDTAKSSTTAIQSTVKRGARPKRTKTQKDNVAMPPPSASRPSRFRTPSRGPTSGWDTPLITPKFDPKLKTTPEGERLPKAGERLMSLDGSPVCVGKHKQFGFIPLNIGSQTLVLPDVPADLNVDDVVIPDLEGDTNMRIQRLHDLLSSYLQQTANNAS